jgi:hypothetical protein
LESLALEGCGCARHTTSARTHYVWRQRSTP